MLKKSLVVKRGCQAPDAAVNYRERVVPPFGHLDFVFVSPQLHAILLKSARTYGPGLKTLNAQTRIRGGWRCPARQNKRVAVRVL